MREYKTFMDLTDDDIKFIVNKIFDTEKITRIKKHIREKYITCNIYTKWNYKEDDGKIATEIMCDELELYDPYSSFRPLKVDFSVLSQDNILYKQFCYSKGIYPDWMNNNPFTKERKQ